LESNDGMAETDNRRQFQRQHCIFCVTSLQPTGHTAWAPANKPLQRVTGTARQVSSDGECTEHRKFGSRQDWSSGSYTEAAQEDTYLMQVGEAPGDPQGDVQTGRPRQRPFRFIQRRAQRTPCQVLEDGRTLVAVGAHAQQTHNMRVAQSPQHCDLHVELLVPLQTGISLNLSTIAPPHNPPIAPRLPSITLDHRVEKWS
jgi:hypothetical protein